MDGFIIAGQRSVLTLSTLRTSNRDLFPRIHPQAAWNGDKLAETRGDSWDL